ncbi:acetate--CoA ligase [Aspergillus homomorphus CBS 101889]|uniref:Acetyl-coenzyme A synthetase n=1 Tax=Aspergillus homomorphus (strain CBS 101889) TaxID=1450537 RepID=A0A395HLS5_ASPHC|nr:acetate--CoA ligase [Aspergillus homomorphus CBS 101889]RAL08881.1 acetate--CoA ligase [Aspergillus homomorphus CBS 101889]
MTPWNRHRHVLHGGLTSFQEYQELHRESIENSGEFWGREARDLISFHQDFTETTRGSLEAGDATWFTGGRLNAAYNCVDRHAATKPNQVAIIFEGDEPGTGRTITYAELQTEVCRAAAMLRALGLQKGDRVVIYMGMIPEVIIATLAVVRLGAIHTIIYDGFSANALAGRIQDLDARLVITADYSRRGGVYLPMKPAVDEALQQCPRVERMLVVRHQPQTQPLVAWNSERDVWWHDLLAQTVVDADLAPEWVDAEHPLFVLYTSGSTGKPKGLVHVTGGFLVGIAVMGKYMLGLREGDVLFCTGEVGWITGLLCGLYTPLLLGRTTVIYEGSPIYPSPLRYWEICEQNRVTHFYAAPTALRLLRMLSPPGEVPLPMTRLRLLGSIGEPIAPEVWSWYHRSIGKGRAHLLDTYGQTETGAFLMAPMAGVTPTKPGSCAFPIFGIDPAIIRADGDEDDENTRAGALVIQKPWPSLARTVWGDHEKFMTSYLRPYPGCYFTGDGARQDRDEYYWITGRLDDVVNVSGHRLSTAEIEAALLELALVAEVAAVGVDDELTGQAVVVFAVLKKTAEPRKPPRASELTKQVALRIGSFAKPRAVHLVPDLPKTRSGKILRRVLRKILEGDLAGIGDTSTMLAPDVIQSVVKVVNPRTFARR